MIINCYKCIYDASVPRTERHPFSDYSYFLSSPLDLHPYVFNKSALKYQSIQLDPDIPSSSLHYESGSISLELFPDSYISQYFLEPTVNYNDFSRILHIIHVFDESSTEPIWTGFLNMDGIKRSFTEDDPGHIQLEIQSVEKYFKEYYSTKTCPDHTTVFGNAVLPVHAPWFNSPLCTEDPPYAIFLDDATFWRKIFGSKCNFTTPSLPPLPSGIASAKRWVNNIPQLYSDSTSETDEHWFLRSGYKRFQQLTVYDLFEKACNSHGWKWRITSNTANTFHIKMSNRAEVFPTTLNLSLSNVDEYHESFFLYKKLYDYIIIPAGYHYWQINSTSSTEGDAIKMITNLHSPVINNSSFFRDMYCYNNHTKYRLTTLFSLSKKYSIKRALATDSFEWAEVTTNSDDFADRTVALKNIKNDNILIIDAGEHSASRTVCDLATRINRPGTRGGSADDLEFTGCVGDMFFIWNPDSSGTKYKMLYNEYSQTTHFWNNFASLLPGSIKKVYELIHPDIILSPDFTPVINSVPYALDSLEVDHYNKTSKLIVTEL